ncbi:MAG: mechanosensitive ion channel domain-containing protein [Succinivibrionaceae bacterium]
MDILSKIIKHTIKIIFHFFITIYIFLCSNIAYAEIDLLNYKDKDPAQLGISVGEIQKKIENIDSLGDLASEIDKKSKIEWQEVLFEITSILQDDEELNMIKSFINGNTRSINELEISKVQSQIQEYKFNLYKYGVKELNNIELNIAKSIEEYTTIHEKFRLNLEKISSLSLKSQDNANKYNNELLDLQSRLNLITTSDSYRESEKFLYVAKISAIKSHLILNNFKLSNSGVLFEKIRSTVQRYKELLNNLNNLKIKIDAQIIDLRKNETLQQNEMLGITPERISNNQFLSELYYENRRLYTELSVMFEKNNDFQKYNRQINTLIERTTKIQQDIENQIQYFDNTIFLSKVLFKKSDLIPNYILPINLNDEINILRLQQYDYSIELEETGEDDNYIAYLSKKYDYPNILKEEDKEVVQVLITSRKKILSALLRELSPTLNNAINMQANMQKYSKIKDSITTQIYNQIFWSPSNLAISKKWFETFDKSLHEQITKIKKVYDKSSFGLLEPNNIVKSLPFIFLWGIISILYSRIKRIKAEINSFVGKIKTDRQSYTPIVIFLTLIQSVRTPLLFGAIGFIILGCTQIGNNINEITEYNYIIVKIVLVVFLYSCVANFILKTCKEGSLAEKHFKIPFNKKVYNRNIRLFSAMGLFLVFITWKISDPQTFSYDILGQVFSILILVYLVVEMSFSLKNKIKKRIGIWQITVSLMSLLLIILDIILVIFGYFYSAIRLANIIIATYISMILYNIIYLSVLRALSLAEKRLYIKRRLEHKVQVQINENKKNNLDDNKELIDTVDSEISVADINEQTRKLFQYILVSCLIVVLYQMWGDIIQLTSYAKYITLYTINGDNESIKTVSLLDLIYVCYSILLSFVFIKNFPGFLEVLIFNRFKTLQNYSYSIITILTYIVFAMCLLFCCSSLGVSWDKLQWLVAALSVGLGFGLQEIFGNFISGLILLFERPIRIGDYITIDGNLCKVLKIRIRSTTVMDFDRKEYIVPNKEFITSKITNWSLEPITRVKMVFGVSYNSDLELVKKLILEVVERNPYVLKEPKYSVVLTDFADSAVEFTLRIYVRSILEMTVCRDSLNMEVFKVFNENNIEIPFNQLDVYIKNTNSAQEIKIHSGNDM